MDPVTAATILFTLLTLGGCAYVILHYLWSKLAPGAAERRKAERAQLRQAYGLDAAAPSERLRLASPRLPVIWFILLTLVTLGVYNGIWAIKRTREFNDAGLEPMSQAGPIVLLVLSILTLPAAFLEIQDPWIKMVLDGSYLASVILVVAIAIGMRRRLSPCYPQASALFTVFFSLYYIQYVINRIQRETDTPTPAAA